VIPGDDGVMIMPMLAGMVMVGVFAASGQGGESLPSGASLAWTSTDRVVVEARQLVERGLLAEAESVLASSLTKSNLKDDVSAARTQALEIIRRLRIEYTLTADALLAKLRHSIPDAAAADLERWRKDGHVECRTLDGQILYFNREPGVLLRICPEAKRRRDQHAGTQPSSNPALPTPDDRLREHLRNVIAEAKKTDKTEVIPIRHRIRYSLTVKPNRPGAKEGSTLRCWLPFPQEYRQQKEVNLIRSSPAEGIIAQSGRPAGRVDGPFSGAPQRTVYLEQKISDPAKAVTFDEEFEYISYAYCPDLKDELAKPQAAVDPSYLAERPPHIVFTPQIRATVDRVVGTEKNPLAKARRIFRYISENVPWVPEHEYALIPNLSAKGLSSMAGDCGVKSMLFITLCRAAGVPARWQSGWVSKPGDTNMHDWSEIYVEPWGWLPVDVSYGVQRSDDPAVRDFYLGHQDAYRMIVNLDYGWPLEPARSSLRSEPADFQRGEVELDGRNLYFDEWTYEIAFDLKMD
jgi:transglutaminase-like putative cysteine protease